MSATRAGDTFLRRVQLPLSWARARREVRVRQPRLWWVEPKVPPTYVIKPARRAGGSHSVLTERPTVTAGLSLLFIWTIMKLVQDSEDAKAKRKSLKPLVEKRRRERINRSLESLKTLLMQPQEGTQRRVEKAEILERTVLFLHKTGAAGGGGGQKNSFHDGFSTCLQKATQFLGPEGKGLCLGAALDASFAARFSPSDSDSAGVQSRTDAQSSSSSLLLTKSSRSILQLLIRKSGYRLCSPALTVVQSCGESHQSPANQQTHKVASRASKQSPTQSQAVSQSLWRPWP